MPKQTGSIDLSSQKQAHDDASKTATNYIYASSDGIKVANASPQSATTYQLQQSDNTRFVIGGNLKSKISGNGFEVFSTNTTGGNDKYRSRIGYYGLNGTVIGKEYSSHIRISDDSFKLQQGDGTPIFSIDIDENEDKTYAVNEIYETNNSTRLQLDSGEYGTVTFYRLTDYDPLTSEYTKTGDYKYVWHYTDDNVWYEVGYGDVRLMDNDDPDWDNIGPQIPVSPSHGFIDPYTAVDAGGQDFIKNYGSKTVEVVYASVSERVSAKTTIGKAYVDGASDNEGNLTIDYHSVIFKSAYGDEFFHVSDRRDRNGYITDYFTGDGERYIFEMTAPPYPDTTTVTIDDNTVSSSDYTIVSTSDYTIDTEQYRTFITFSDVPEDETIISVHYKPNSSDYKPVALTFGQRIPKNPIGNVSICLGLNNVASGETAYAEGYGCKALGLASHAHGYYSKASNYYTTAEGGHTVASGLYSHAQNLCTKAEGYAQTSLGRYNYVGSDVNSYAIVVGNGQSENSRSNALTISWDGFITTKADPNSDKKISSTAPSSNIVLAETVNKDADGNQIGYSQITFTTSNIVQRSFMVQRGSTTNGLWLGVNSSGARTLGFSDSSIWRNALFGVSTGVVPANLGGTGQTSLQATRKAMGLGDTTGALPVANGGSGMTACAQGNISPASGTTVGNLVYRCWGKVVTIYMYNIKFTAAVADNGTHDVGTVPSNYRPSYISFAQVATNKLSGPAYMRIDTSGNITFNNQSGGSLAASSTVSCTLTYVVS